MQSLFRFFIKSCWWSFYYL